MSKLNLTQNFYNTINETLSSLADSERLLDGSSSDKMVKGGDTPVGFYVGSIKGTPRKHTHVNYSNGSGESGLIGHRAMGFNNILIANWKNGVFNHIPFTYYGFSRSHNNGQLCKELHSKVALATKNHAVYDPVLQTMKPAASDYFGKVYPVVNIKFLNSSDEVVNDDILVHGNIMRLASLSGQFSSDLEKGIQRDEFKSVVTMDTKNGWHPQDALDTATAPRPLQIKYSNSVNLLRMAPYWGGNTIVTCNIGIVKQTNFSIITKVTKEILGKTDRITVDLEPHTNDFHRLLDKILLERRQRKD